jgi:hypothetical protein
MARYSWIRVTPSPCARKSKMLKTSLTSTGLAASPQCWMASTSSQRQRHERDGASQAHFERKKNVTVGGHCADF